MALSSLPEIELLRIESRLGRHSTAVHPITQFADYVMERKSLRILYTLDARSQPLDSSGEIAIEIREAAAPPHGRES
jgi:hypothetical protein